MPRQSQTADVAGIKDTTLVIDNGGYTMKTGFVSTATPQLQDCHIIPNCVARDSDRKVWVASQLEQCKDFREMAFRRPVEKGFMVNWEVGKAIWNESFFNPGSELKCDPHETNLLLTEAPNCPQTLQTNCDQVIFEEFEFASYNRCLGPALNAYNDIHTLFNDGNRVQDAHQPAECLLVIDSGYSHTTITPLINGRPVQQAIRRLDIGGKFLTNYLKEQLSIRAFYAMDETYVVNELKESACFVSEQFKIDLDASWKGGKRDRREIDTSIVVDYVLPDYETIHHGTIRPHDPSAEKRGSAPLGQPSREKVVRLGNERFAIPELLFNPGDVGMKEAGLPEMVMESVRALPEGLRPAMLVNMVLIGGNANIPGLQKRLETEVRQRAPTEYNISLACPQDPIKQTWLGGATVASNRESLKQLLVTRADYLEHGPNWLIRKFGSSGKSSH
ncbi:hypothetical protein EG328_008777 [Venturia inaequalis]|uniref:Actin-like protein ARP6 n=1 Tax=Venturia inaequalis TaxID=5025 RepID=A0A8H3UA39_VENIN|nr:hypothetical protein EG328_008777 [Venturia inaequalis]KAE9968278.1 hypothetical protein EG327_011116 [Venturia inaequalis]RDI88821.1 hypothetical protein Vi05172_g1464 [Venturia inaequalis]